MRRRKRRFVLCAMITIIVSLFVNATLAYFTTENRARNVITTGSIQVDLIEEVAGGDRYPTEPQKIMPGSEVSKIAYLKAGDESQPAYVRMKYVITIEVGGQVMEHTQEELAEIITIAPASDNWEKGADGWYYYNTAIAAGATTDPLFEEVTFSGANMDNRYQNATITIDVLAQAVQTAHNGETAMDAAGWPE